MVACNNGGLDAMAQGISFILLHIHSPPKTVPLWQYIWKSNLPFAGIFSYKAKNQRSFVTAHLMLVDTLCTSTYFCNLLLHEWNSVLSFLGNVLWSQKLL